MFSKIKEKAQARTPKIIAVETAVVDLQYDKNAGDNSLKQDFFAHMKELIAQGGGEAGFSDNPRAGDMRLIAAEDYDAGLIALGRKHNLFDAAAGNLPPREQALLVSQKVFGAPGRVAGGSLANTFHAVVNASIDGQKLADGHFVTAVGDDPSGAVFAASLYGNILYKSEGRQMECHVYPVDNDRILIATPSKSDPAESYIKDVFNQCPLTGRDRIMLGGFLFFTAGFHEIYDSVIDHLKSLPETGRPVVVVTAAAQAVAASNSFRDKILNLVSVADMVVHANTGEFRRFLDVDTKWRNPFENNFAGLDGQELEDAKNACAEYKKAKIEANREAIASATLVARLAKGFYQRDLRFIVTDGPRSTYVVSADGCETFAPGKLNKSQIVNTVGAGDNFAAGFQLGDLYGLPHKLSVDLGHDFAKAVIQQPAARLDARQKKTVTDLDGSNFELGGALSHFDTQHISDAARNALFGPKPEKPKP